MMSAYIVASDQFMIKPAYLSRPSVSQVQDRIGPICSCKRMKWINDQSWKNDRLFYCGGPKATGTLLYQEVGSMVHTTQASVHSHTKNNHTQAVTELPLDMSGMAFMQREGWRFQNCCHRAIPLDMGLSQAACTGLFFAARMSCCPVPPTCLETALLFCAAKAWGNACGTACDLCCTHIGSSRTTPTVDDTTVYTFPDIHPLDRDEIGPRAVCTLAAAILASACLPSSLPLSPTCSALHNCAGAYLGSLYSDILDIVPADELPEEL